MIKIDNFDRQHNTIKDEINAIENELQKDDLSSNASEIALHISKLAGHLKIHLMEEDKFLYPNLLSSSDKEIQMKANQYIHEMGNLANEYTNFKNNYNVGRKITESANAFLKDAKIIINLLKKRIEKEDNELYTLIKVRNL